MSNYLITENNLQSVVLFTDQSLVDGEGEIDAKVSDILNIQGANQLNLLVAFTIGDSSGVRIKVEFSEDRETWYQESMISEYPSAADVEHTIINRLLESSGNYVISIPVSASWLRLTCTAITDGTDAEISITATVASI